MQDQTASRLIGELNLSQIKVNVFRFKQSLDDPTMLFWRPCEIYKGEWPFIFFLKLEERKLLPNKDLEASVQKIDRTKVNFTIPVLEIANKQFLYAYIQTDSTGHSATFNGGKDFNQIDWQSIQAS